jgi:adenosylcobinamide-GDP ribazoletransferase
VVPLVVGFPYARPEGLGKPFHGHAGLAQLAGATAVAALALGWIGTRAIAPGICGVLAALAIALWLHRHLGGLTGDVYGAAIEAAELGFLVVAGLR